jgi:uncharacterized membrane protein YfcA
MSEQILTLLLLLGAGAAAGALNTIAGGGSLVTLPLLIFLGLPATVANATNRIALFIGSIGATQSFAKRGLIPMDWLKMGLPPSLVGVVFGVWGATQIGDVAFERVLAVVLLGSAVLIMVQPLVDEGLHAPPPAGGTVHRRWLLLAFFALGVYSGFIRAGVGFLFTALLAWQGLDMVRANGVKAALILAYAALSVGLFMFTGLLDWRAGLSLAAGQYFGSKAGVSLQVLKGQRWVRTVFILAIIGFALQLVLSG